MGYYSKLASAIYNDIVSGLRGYTSNPTISIDLLEDEIVEERLELIKEYLLKGILPKKDLLMSINCIPIDCKNLENCTCGRVLLFSTPSKHFEIPQLMTGFYDGSIEYIGSIDKSEPFVYYTSINLIKLHKLRKRLQNKPYVYIDITPNKNNKNDCWVFNAPLIKNISVIGIFKDLRLLCPCNEDLEINNISFLDTEIKKRLTEKKIKYYRQLAAPLMPNTQAPQ